MRSITCLTILLICCPEHQVQMKNFIQVISDFNMSVTAGESASLAQLEFLSAEAATVSLCGLLGAGVDVL